MSRNVADILYTPLWLGLEPPPRPEFEAIMAWADAASASQELDIIARQANSTLRTAHGFRACAYTPEKGGWQQGFEKAFPDIAQYILHLPTDKSRMNVELLCVNEPVDLSVEPATEVFNTIIPHTDNDTYCKGLRIYMWHDGLDRLQLRSVKSAYQALYRNKARNKGLIGRGVEFAERHCNRPVTCRTLPGLHAWMIDNALGYPHNVDLTNCPKRCILAIDGIVWEDLEPVIAASIAHFPEHAVAIADLPKD